MFFLNIEGVEKTLPKHRFLRQTKVMESSRKQFHNSIDIFQSWRNFRKHGKYFDPIYIVRLKDSILRKEFEAVRDMVITDILLSNAQRPGAIIGMEISKVKDAMKDIVSETTIL